MDLINFEIQANGSRAYFFHNNKKAENFNFYDYSIKDYEKHLVIEGNWEVEFEKLKTIDVEALSIVAIDKNVDVSFILEYFPKIRQLFIKTKSFTNCSVISSLIFLQDLSIVCTKNFVINLELPASIKSFIVDWKSKYSIAELPAPLEYLSIEKGKGLEWENLISNHKKIQKIELIDCDIDCGAMLLRLPILRYLSLINCPLIHFAQDTDLKNNSLKYIYFDKVPIKNIDWLNGLSEIDILILENCGEIKNIFSLKNKRSLRGLSLAAKTKIVNGDLSSLETLSNLSNCFIAPFKHYTHKSCYSWNWKNFSKSEHIRMVQKIK